MCLLLLGCDVHPDAIWIIAANRDEFYDRPTASLQQWEDAPDIVAGRDLKEGGTWMGISRRGRFGALTNYRDPASLQPNAPSRGMLVHDFLVSDRHPKAYLEGLLSRMHRFNGFNLVVGDASGLFYLGNRCGSIQAIQPGWHALSNHCLDTPWPKTERALEGVQAVVQPNRGIDVQAIFDVLTDAEPAPDDRLPDTGVGREWERILSPIFIQSPSYGTRSSSVLVLNRRRQVFFWETTHQPTCQKTHPDAIVMYGPIHW
ncbi:MAG: NRDE family protein [Thermodesulfobacteriota bacterium]